MRKNIKNYTSEQKLDTTAALIQKILARAGAKRVMFDYDDNGDLEGIAFFIKTSQGEIPIKLPARVEKVHQVMYSSGKEYVSPRIKEARMDQAKRTAWKNIQDWIDAQCAMIETDMVKMEEVFLPYMATPTGETFYEVMEDKGFLLPSGKKDEDLKRRTNG